MLSVYNIIKNNGLLLLTWTPNVLNLETITTNDVEITNVIMWKNNINFDSLCIGSFIIYCISTANHRAQNCDEQSQNTDIPPIIQHTFVCIDTCSIPSFISQQGKLKSYMNISQMMEFILSKDWKPKIIKKNLPIFRL